MRHRIFLVKCSEQKSVDFISKLGEVLDEGYEIISAVADSDGYIVYILKK